MASSKKKSDANLNSTIDQFCAVTGAGRDVAKQLLDACAGNLELAIDMHMEGPGTSEQSGSGYSSAGNSNSNTGDDDVRAPIPQTQEVLVDDTPVFVTRGRGKRKGFRGRRRKARSVFDGFRDFQAEAQQQEEQTQGGESSQSRKQRTLEDLFRPPIDITYKGTFENAREVGTTQGKWLMVNIQNVQEFQCQALNRDLWSNSTVKGLIKKHFIFWQVYHDSEEGKKYKQFYKVGEWPYIAILDPQTGENLTVWTKIDVSSFSDLVAEFLEQQPRMESVCSDTSVDKQESIVDATEDDQLLAAIQASLTEVQKPIEPELSSEGSELDSDCELETFTDSDDSIPFPPAKMRKISKESPLAGSVKVENVAGSSKVLSAEGASGTVTKPSISTDSGKSPVKKSKPVSIENGKTSPIPGSSATGSVFSFPCSPSKAGTSRADTSKADTSQADTSRGSTLKTVKDSGNIVTKSVPSDNTTVSLNAAKTSDNSSPTSSLPEKPASAISQDYKDHLGPQKGPKTTVMLRFPDGKRDQLSIPSTSKLLAVVLYVASKGFSNESYELVAHFPRRHLSHLDFQDTLADIGFHAQETVFVQAR